MEESGGGRDDDRRSVACDPGRVAERCTAVVPAWRAEATLLGTLSSLVVHNGDAVERVVVVGCAEDRCLDIARRFREVRVVTLPRRATAGAARNRGRAVAGECELLLFVDADCVLAPGAVRRLIERLRTQDLGAAGAAISQHGSGIIGWLRHLLEFKEASPGVPAVAPRFLPSAVLLVNARLFDTSGGFPDLWPGEDLVLSRRMLDAGARLEKVGEAEALHVHPEEFLAYLGHQYRLGKTAAMARNLAGGAGTGFVGRPFLVPVLFAGRAVRAFVWVARFRPAEMVRFVVSFPLFLLGLTAWTFGFAGVTRTENPT